MFFIGLIQSNKRYRIASYGDSITFGYTWQPLLNKVYNTKILNLGIGASAISKDGQVPSVLDGRNILIWRYQGDLYLFVKRIFEGCFSRAKRLDFTFMNPTILSHDSISSTCRVETIPYNLDILLVMAGTNDVNEDINVFSSLYRQTINRIIQRNPKQTYILTPIVSSSEKDDLIHQKMEAIRDSIKLIANDFNIDVIDMENCGISLYNIENTTYDGVHPNKSGGEIMGKYILKKMGKDL